MAHNLIRSSEFRQDLFRQLLSQLHTPLIEGIDIPDHALDEDLVLVQCDQRTQDFRRQPGVEKRIGRPVTGECFSGYQ